MDPYCAFVEELYDLAPFQAVQWLYILMSVVSIVLVCYTARHYLHKTIFENVTKELIIALYIYIAIYAVFLFTIQVAQLVYRYIASEKCNAQIPKSWCFLRFALTVLSACFVILHVGITAQFLLSTFLFGARIQKMVARFSIVVSFLWPAVLGAVAFSHDSLEGRTAYCSGITAGSAKARLVLEADLFVLAGLHILNIATSIFLWKYNSHKVNTDSTVRQSFDLSRTFHRRQNLYAMQQFLPISLVSGILFLIFFASVNFSEALKSSMSPGWYMLTSMISNVIPWYCFLCPLIFFLLVRRGRFRRQEHVMSMVNTQRNPNEMYFGALKDQWK